MCSFLLDQNDWILKLNLPALEKDPFHFQPTDYKRTQNTRRAPQ